MEKEPWPTLPPSAKALDSVTCDQKRLSHLGLIWLRKNKLFRLSVLSPQAAAFIAFGDGSNSAGGGKPRRGCRGFVAFWGFWGLRGSGGTLQSQSAARRQLRQAYFLTFHDLRGALLSRLAWRCAGPTAADMWLTCCRFQSHRVWFADKRNVGGNTSCDLGSFCQNRRL
jgi:hypothetical protein